jgi:hypothetical protein
VNACIRANSSSAAAPEQFKVAIIGAGATSVGGYKTTRWSPTGSK